MAATASATGGASSQASGGESTLYAGVWWPPYHWPFQMVKPSWPNRSARKVCAARSTVRGCQIRYAVVKIAATTIGAAFHGSMRLYQRARGLSPGKARRLRGRLLRSRFRRGDWRRNGGRRFAQHEGDRLAETEVPG